MRTNPGSRFNALRSLVAAEIAPSIPRRRFGRLVGGHVVTYSWLVRTFKRTRSLGCGSGCRSREYGVTTEDPATAVAMQDKLLRKGRVVAEELDRLPAVNVYGAATAPLSRPRSDSGAAGAP